MIRLLTCLLVCALALPAHALEMHDRIQDYIVTAADGLVVRPVLLAATVTGAVLFVAGLPFTFAADPALGYQILVAEPARATFTRCLGCEPGEDRSGLPR